MAAAVVRDVDEFVPRKWYNCENRLVINPRSVCNRADPRQIGVSRSPMRGDEEQSPIRDQLWCRRAGSRLPPTLRIVFDGCGMNRNNRADLAWPLQDGGGSSTLLSHKASQKLDLPRFRRTGRPETATWRTSGPRGNRPYRLSRRIGRKSAGHCMGFAVIGIVPPNLAKKSTAPRQRVARLISGVRPTFGQDAAPRYRPGPLVSHGKAAARSDVGVARPNDKPLKL